MHRKLLHAQDTFAKAPPRGGSVYRDESGKDMVLGELADNDIPRMAGSPADAAF